MYTVTRTINNTQLTVIAFESWQAAYKYCRACAFLFIPSWDPNKYQYSLTVHNPSGIEIKKIILL